MTSEFNIVLYLYEISRPKTIEYFRKWENQLLPGFNECEIITVEIEKETMALDFDIFFLTG